VKLAIFNSKPYEREFFLRLNQEHGHDLEFLEPRLSIQTAPLAAGSEAICAFVNLEFRVFPATAEARRV
jgi:D-lactate dehydrogenase